MKRDFATKLTCNLGDFKWFVMPDFRTGEEDNDITMFPIGNITVGKVISISGANDCPVCCNIETFDGKTCGGVQELFFNSLPEVLDAMSKVSDGIKGDWFKGFMEKVNISYDYEVLFKHGYEIVEERGHKINIDRCIFSLGTTKFEDVVFQGESIGEIINGKKIARNVHVIHGYEIVKLKNED